ncbi:MAG: putative sulfate exporter family transporter [Eubacteriales bacterium]|nr:putative sulfate exporter family transporter [Eubacteriales bacterium]
MIWNSFKEKVPGFILVMFIVIFGSIISSYINKFIMIETITLVIFMGIIINNTIGIKEIFQPGITFIMNKVIKLAIILLGFKLNFTVLSAIGVKAFLLVIFFVPLVLFLGWRLGKFFDLESKTSLLIGIGSGICGVAAIMALSPLVKAKKEDIVIAASITSFLGAIGVILFSFLGTLNNFPLNPTAFGIWSGISLHGVSHAIAAAFSMGETAGEAGTVVKLTRVLMLIPLSVIFTKHFYNEGEETNSTKYSVKNAWIQAFPLYVVIFLLVMILNSVGMVPEKAGIFLGDLSSKLFLMTMTSMGLSLYLKNVLVTGIKGLKVGIILFSFVSILSYNLIGMLY